MFSIAMLPCRLKNPLGLTIPLKKRPLRLGCRKVRKHVLQQTWNLKYINWIKKSRKVMGEMYSQEPPKLHPPTAQKKQNSRPQLPAAQAAGEQPRDPADFRVAGGSAINFIWHGVKVNNLPEPHLSLQPSKTQRLAEQGRHKLRMSSAVWTNPTRITKRNITKILNNDHTADGTTNQASDHIISHPCLIFAGEVLPFLSHGRTKSIWRACELLPATRNAPGMLQFCMMVSMIQEYKGKDYNTWKRLDDDVTITITTYDTIARTWWYTINI